MAASPINAYVVCSTQRSGSTYLCRLLADTELAGNPQEYFEATAETGLPPRPGFFLAGLPRLGVGIRSDPRPADAPDYSNLRLVDGWLAHLERTFQLGTTANGVFATKLMWNQLAEVEQHARAVPGLDGKAGADLLDELFGGPSYVWVRRRDKVRQAISLWRAVQTRIWLLERSSDADSSVALRYSFAAIDHLRRRLTVDDEAWGRFFSVAGIKPLELCYEDDVERDPAKAVSRVFAHVGIDASPSSMPMTSMVRQSDELSDAWQAAYDRDAAHVIV